MSPHRDIMGQSFSNLSPFSRDHIMAELRIDQTRSVIRNGQTNITFRPPRHYTPWLRERRESEMILLSLAQSVAYFSSLLSRQLGHRIIRSLLLENGFFAAAAAEQNRSGPIVNWRQLASVTMKLSPWVYRAAGKLLRGRRLWRIFFLDTRKGSNFYITPTREAKLAQTAAQQKGFECFVEDEMRNAKLFSCSLIQLRSTSPKRLSNKSILYFYLYVYSSFLHI